MTTKPLRIAFLHPDLGIGGAERLVVDAALGLQRLGHTVDLYTSYHDPKHCFEETIDGSLTVHYIVPPFPRSFKGKLHILFAHLRQLHLTKYLLSSSAPRYDVYFVDQLSTCIPFLRLLGGTRVVFYCHFPDKLLAHGAFVEGSVAKPHTSFLKQIYRLPMDWLEEVTTRQADVILANSKFTGRVFKAYFPSIPKIPQIVYPGINLSAYEGDIDHSDPDIISITSSSPTLLSLNRFEGKKNALLALKSFAILKQKRPDLANLRLVLAGGYDPRLQDNTTTLNQLLTQATSLSLTYTLLSPSLSSLPPFPSPQSQPPKGHPDVLFILNFTTAQRTALLRSPSTLALLYTPANEHFGIVPVEAMACGLPVLACDSGGPVESVVSVSAGGSCGEQRTGWLRPPDPELWAEALGEIVSLPLSERERMAEEAKARARTLFGMDAMARGIEKALVDAREMGSVQVDLGVWRIWGVMFLGFLVAYLLGPYLLP